MANQIWNRRRINGIIADENLSADEKTEQIFAIQGQYLDEGYVSKTAAENMKQSAIEEAKKSFTAPDPKESDAYKELDQKFAAYRTKQEARFTDDYKSVKPKFFDAVYDRIDRKEGAKPVSEQLEAIKAEYEEFFIPAENPDKGKDATKPPMFSKPAGDPVPPASEEDKIVEQLRKNWSRH